MAIGRPNGDHVPVLGARLVPGHCRELVHEAELHDPAEPRNEAVAGAGRIEACRVGLARVRFHVLAWDANGTDRHHGPFDRVLVVEDREDLRSG